MEKASTLGKTTALTRVIISQFSLEKKMKFTAHSKDS